MVCVKECPVNAIKEEGSFPPHVNKISCAQMSKKLRKEYRSPCGIWIKVCPVGKDRKIFNREDTSIYDENKTLKSYKKAWKHVRSYGSKK